MKENKLNVEFAKMKLFMIYNRNSFLKSDNRILYNLSIVDLLAYADEESLEKLVLKTLDDQYM